MFYSYGPGFGWGWGLFSGIIWLLFIVCCLAALIWVIRHHVSGSWNGANPLDIAKQRYAKGEINKEQFEQLKRDLK